MDRFPLSYGKITVQYDGQREHLIGQHGCVNKLILICCRKYHISNTESLSGLMYMMPSANQCDGAILCMVKICII